MNLVNVEPVWQPANQQQVYRLLLNAMSYPGRVYDLRPAIGESRAELSILACLVDDMVAYSDPDGRLDPRERRLLSADCIAPELADFILHDAQRPPRPDYTPRLGELYRPDSAATLILSGAGVGVGAQQLTLQGPGIAEYEQLHVDGFDPEWFKRREEWGSNFPQGVDIFLCDRTHIAALPRTCRLDF